MYRVVTAKLTSVAEAQGFLTFVFLYVDFCHADFVQIKETYCSPNRFCRIIVADGENKIWISCFQGIAAEANEVMVTVLQF